MKSSVCGDIFLSHPQQSLVDHLVFVGNKSLWIARETKFQDHEIAFYAGLLHDLGKLNPYYQISFREKNNNDVENKMRELREKYVSVHSPFSSWLADKLLETKIDRQKIKKIMTLIQYHHSSLKHYVKFNENTPVYAAKKGIIDSLEKFYSETYNHEEFKNLNWQCIHDSDLLSIPINSDFKLKNTNFNVEEFAKLSYFFSCLLQADLGSFEDWYIQKYDLIASTTALARVGNLSELRSKFNSSVMKDFDNLKGISIIEAPTGIGKTKAFLELADRLVKEKDLERIFYFSPLLALTDDFESKIKGNDNELPVFDKKYHDDILTYNHMFAGSLQDKELQEKRSENTFWQKSWSFNYESFNKKFVITTTKRFLMTIYSNGRMSKLKLASFRNSVLILDEIQTIPKHILSNLVKIMEIFHKKMNVWFLLVSATVPHELNHLYRINIDKGLLDLYKKETYKKIEYKNGDLDLSYVIPQRTLIMQNTRKKAVQTYLNARAKFDDVFYISSGIRKIDRDKIIAEIKPKSKERFVLVSTQVVEAGIDISFSHVFREQAPLDSIVQMLGRLDRERTAKEPATMVVFEGDGNYIPYSHLEYQKSVNFLRDVSDSKDLLDKCIKYYEEIYNSNLQNRKYNDQLDGAIAALDFESVWNQVRNFVDPDDQRDTIFIPPEELWNEFKEEFMKDKITKTVINKFIKYGVKLPKPLTTFNRLVPFKNWLDEELLDKHVLLPKKEFLGKVYDFEPEYNKGIGLDQWLLNNQTKL